MSANAKPNPSQPEPDRKDESDAEREKQAGGAVFSIGHVGPGTYSGTSIGQPAVAGMGATAYGVGMVGQRAAAEKTVQQLNALLRGEIAAVETYDAVRRRLSDDASPEHLQAMDQTRQDHTLAAKALRQRIVELKGEPADSSGAAGVWAALSRGLATLFGPDVVLRSLRDAEKHALDEYRQSLDDIDAPSAQLVQSQLIPAQQQHVETLERLLVETGE